MHLGAAALAWGPKTKLKFLVIEDHTYGHVGTHKDLALSICRLTDLRSSGGIHDLLLEDESGYPVLAGAGTARSPLAPAWRVRPDHYCATPTAATSRPCGTG